MPGTAGIALRTRASRMNSVEVTSPAAASCSVEYQHSRVKLPDRPRSTSVAEVRMRPWVAEARLIFGALSPSDVGPSASPKTTEPPLPMLLDTSEGIVEPGAMFTPSKAPADSVSGQYATSDASDRTCISSGDRSGIPASSPSRSTAATWVRDCAGSVGKSGVIAVILPRNRVYVVADFVTRTRMRLPSTKLG